MSNIAFISPQAFDSITTLEPFSLTTRSAEEIPRIEIIGKKKRVFHDFKITGSSRPKFQDDLDSRIRSAPSFSLLF